MKIGITQRLFLSILVATCLALLCMLLIMQWSIDRGFLSYLKVLDQGRQEQIAARLEQVYSEQGSWDFLREDQRYLAMRLMPEKPNAAIASERLNQFDDRPVLHPPPPPPMDGPRLPVVILDAKRKPLFGNPSEASDANFRSLKHNGDVVGYLGLLSPKHFPTPPQLEFMKHQKLALILATLGMVLVVGIFSIPLADRMVRPIKAIAAATHHLASGEYSIRVPVKSSDELGQLATDFNAMALTLEHNEKERRQWVADISHELRTPLAILRGEIEALMEGIRSTSPEAICSLHAEVMRLHRLVEDLYQLALSDLGTLTYRKEDLNLSDILWESIDSYKTEFARKGITITEGIAEGSDLRVFADSERLYQLFGNLLDNSLKYTDPGGKLVIKLSQQNGRAEIVFQDTAPGVPEGELDRLFDRLYRVEGSRNRTSGGSGLGLAICRNIVAAHDGKIFAFTSPIGGLTIMVDLPLTGRFS
jgi:two-component system sensor histidine kinase BaeS